MELAASEPNVMSPVAMAFDERGRLFVVEMIDYSERRDVIPHMGRIRMLEDKKGNGFFDKSTVYADNLPWPTAVFCYDGGILVSAKSNGKDKLLISVLDPSREVAPQYIAFNIETKDGESYVGIIANETTSSITVRQPYGKEDVILRSNIKSMKSQKQSLMPEGLEAGLQPQDFANLLEYISTANADK